MTSAKFYSISKGRNKISVVKFWFIGEIIAILSYFYREKINRDFKK